MSSEQRPEDVTIGQVAGWKPTGADPAAPQREFFAPPPGPELGRPEDDLPFTIRMQPPYTWERRHDPATPRVVKLHPRLLEPWAVLDYDLRLPGPVARLTDDEVRDWPIQHSVMVAAVMAKVAPQRPQEGPAADLVGDMGVEAFKG